MNNREQPRRLDAVEIKVNIASDGIPAAAEVFDLRHAGKRRRTIYFCEDPAGPDGPAGLPLFNHGIIIRLRRNKGRRDDITVKLRPEDSRLTEHWITEHGDGDWEFRVEEDWAGPRQVTSASLEAKLEEGIIETVVREGRGVPLLPDQRRFLTDCARTQVEPARLIPLGPVVGTKWDLTRNGREISAEKWAAGDKLRFLEFSIRVRPQEATAAQQEFENLFREHHIDPGAVQETKTRLVLDYLSSGGGHT